MTRPSNSGGLESSYRQLADQDVDEARHPLEYGLHLASVTEKKRLWWRNATIHCIFIASWFIFATILSLYNKWMFSPDHFAFPYPLFVTTLHMIVQFLLAALLRTLWPARFIPTHKPTYQAYGKKAVPTAVATSLDIGMSNVSLKTITLSFYTMCKSSSLIFVLIFAFLFRLEKFSWRLIGVIFLIFSGVLLMVATESHFVLQGFILVLSASCLGGLRWSLTQLLLQDKKMGMDNPASTIYWLSPTMGLTLFVLSVVVEGLGNIFGSPFFNGIVRTLITIAWLMTPGIIAFCMVMSEFYIIQRTGVVPMSIAGIAKEVTTITISAWFFGDQLSPLNITGVGITVCGIILFTFHKYRKSIESTVPLDAHGNPITDEISEEYQVDYQLELDETQYLTGRPSEDSDEDARSDYTTHTQASTLVFPADGDAEELRSIRSTKMHWGPNGHALPMNDSAAASSHPEIHASMLPAEGQTREPTL